MSLFSRIVLLCILILHIPACTVYTEKQTEAVSQVVYATKDSIDKARFDLADGYINETTRLVRPPKNRITIQTVAEPVKDFSTNSKVTLASPKTPVIIVPERLRGLKVIVVNSEEYATLMRDKESHEQLKADYANLEQSKKLVDEEIITQTAHRDKILNELNYLKESISNKKLIIMKLSITCVALGSSLIGMVFLKIKGII